MLEVLQIFSDKNFIPHEYSYLWKPTLMWLQAANDLINIFSYFSIPLLLVYLVRQRRNRPLTRILQLFGTQPGREWRESSNQRLSLLVQQTPLAVIEWTPDFKVAAWNPAAEKIFGYSKSEVLGRHAVELMVPETAREQVNCVWEQLLQQKGGTRSTNENCTKEGETIYCEWYNTPLIDSEGQVMGVASLVQDITDVYNELRLRKLAQEALQQAKNQLEIRVEARTQELKQALVELNEVIIHLQREIDQRREVEAALQEREGQYRSVVDNVKEVIFQTDANGFWTFLNPAWSEITGFAIADSIGTSCLNYLHPDDWQCNQDQFKALLERKQEYCRYQVRCLTTGGGYRWIEVFIQLTFDTDGAISGTCGTLYDITERHLSEATLRESEQRFRSLVANIPGVVYRRGYDADWTMKFISHAIKEIFSYSAADLLHNQVRTFASLIEPQDLARVESVISKCVAQRQPYVVEYRIICADGSIRWVYDKGQGIFDADGRMLWLDGVIFDSTGYRQKEEELRSSEEKFRQLTENIREVFFLTNLDWSQMLYISPAYEDVWGRTTQSLYDRPMSWLDTVHPEDLNRVAATVARCLGEEQNFEADFRIMRPDGLVRWIWVRTFLIRNQAGVVMRIAGLAEDITERKQAEAEIVNALSKEKELGDLKSRFISITSHEFRTPLTTIMSTAELLEYYEWTKQEEVEQLHLIQDSVKQMLHLLEDLLFIGTADAGQLRFTPEPLELNEFCRQLIAQIQGEASWKTSTTSSQPGLTQASVNFVSPDQTLLACMDKKLLRQLLSNLLLNARKYSPYGGIIQFELACQGDMAVFQIQDRGIGIPQEDQPRVFEFFHRAKNVGAIAGTGLGLAIVKQCVDLHGGNIAVESEVGVGTRFTVTLPLKNHFSIAPYDAKQATTQPTRRSP